MPSRSVRRHLSKVWGVALAATALCLSLALGYNQLLARPDPEAEGLPAIPPTGIFAITIAVAIGTFIDKTLELSGSRKALERQERQSRVTRALANLLVSVHESTAVPVRDIGVSIFADHGRRGQVGIVRVARYRLDNSPLASKVAWEPGKGAVGQCWETRRVIHRDWHPQLSEHSRPDLPKSEFEQLPSEVTDGFTHDEFRGIADKYSEVCAFPVLSVAGEIVAVMSIDVAARARLEECRLGTDEVAGAVTAVTEVIFEDIGSLERLE